MPDLDDQVPLDPSSVSHLLARFVLSYRCKGSRRACAVDLEVDCLKRKKFLA